VRQNHPPALVKGIIDAMSGAPAALPAAAAGGDVSKVKIIEVLAKMAHCSTEFAVTAAPRMLSAPSEGGSAGRTAAGGEVTPAAKCQWLQTP
jgi:hypothetical protein